MYRRMLPLLLLLGGCASHPPSDSVQLCQTLVYAYPEIRDNGSAEQYADLFTDNARFSVDKLNIELDGKAQIVARFNKARKNTTTVHMMTSTRQYRQNTTLAAESHFILLLKSKAQPDTTKIINGRYLDTFDYDETQCRFSNRTVLIDRMDVL
ncbi:nuclear transport factor 2 family protein [Pseudoalteromonas sp. DL2-H2.2]|uniref:nuclear transport factor 2 family protein n=1 Tax=Pseudoalteromonas sp. DL2-H2.2 TaxID=2908889 RepID=UPI001F2F3484|nr:nuclear transport factor 2 family protein [Pseudoalteromonas sp. DL2-H2.2]MCF2906896.1 nuclear transport factor 2 family protein [Pseudoalteromonas sp. DL2-H2.2]